ncbi:MAG: PD-(D/E)XK nuclease domain-containing protein, partial [Tannerellaceae bacterium]|nr:PD-(D/E)XK nuclease domain-containing protein [Tannerellaceae bacterium]
LGLIKEGERKRLEPGNPIYAEVIARFLSSQPQMALSVENSPAQSSKFIHDGIVDMDLLLLDFRNFWRENSDIWEEKLTYKESAPHLVLFAFLQRVINGGGQIIREMATGKGRVDINVVYQGHNYPIELKICRQREKLDTIIAQGLEQTERYMDSLGSKKAHLLIFDNHDGLSWEQRLWTRTHTTSTDAHITILGS